MKLVAGTPLGRFGEPEDTSVYGTVSLFAAELALVHGRETVVRAALLWSSIGDFLVTAPLVAA